MPCRRHRAQHSLRAPEPQVLEAEGEWVLAEPFGDLVDHDLLDAACRLDVDRAVGNGVHVDRHRRQLLGANAEVVRRRDHGLEDGAHRAEPPPDGITWTFTLFTGKPRSVAIDC